MKMVMPKMGMTMEEGTIVEWKKKDGEYVEKGEIILEIMTNKVNIDVEAPSSGYIKALKGPDDVVPVGEIIAIIEESREALKMTEAPEMTERPGPVGPEIPVHPESSVQPEGLIQPEIPAGKRIPASPRARKLAEEKGIPLQEITGTGPDGAITEKDVLMKIGGVEEPVSKPVPPPPVPVESTPELSAVSPLAERIAHETGVDLSRVQGTGIGGKITKDDVLRYIEKGVEPEPVRAEPVIPAEPEVTPEVPEVPEVQVTEAAPGMKEPEVPEVPVAAPEVVSKVTAGPEVTPRITPEPMQPEITPVEGIPLTGIRKLTAERMLKSKREAPHLTLGMEVDMTEASKLKDSLSLSFTDVLVKATALALKKHPIMNSTLTQNTIVLREKINIGIAVAREKDLFVPVIHEADKKSLREISRLTKDIIKRTQEDELTEHDVLDGTFTISNLGMYDIDFFTPIINPPEAAILGVGKIEKKPVVIAEKIQIRERVTLSLSFDHRIVNGMPAAIFLQEIKYLLEHPYRLLVEGET